MAHHTPFRERAVAESASARGMRAVLRITDTTVGTIGLPRP